MADKFLKTLKLPGIDEPYKIPQTAEDVGAAPNGYGYGGTAVYLGSVTSEDELNTAIESIYANMEKHESKMVRWYGYPSNAYNFFGILTKSSENYGSVSAHSAYQKGSLLLKTKLNGAWQPLEWENPPKEIGVEYRTIERWNGKPVYTQLVNIGTLPNSGTITVDIGTGIMPILFDGVAVSSSYVCPLNCLNSVKEMWYTVSTGKISITTQANASSYTAYVVVKYTKD